MGILAGLGITEEQAFKLGIFGKVVGSLENGFAGAWASSTTNKTRVLW